MAAVAGCRGGEPDPGPRTLVAKLAVEPNSAALGGSMTVTLTITQSGGEPTTFSVFDDGHSFDPVVKDAAGTIVWTANAGRQVAPDRREITLASGEAYTTSLVWDLTDNSKQPLPPGSYSIDSRLDAVGLIPGFTEITAPVTIRAK